MNWYTVHITKRFEKDLDLCKKRGLKLSGNYAGYWECHIKGDWLLVWEQNDNELTLIFTSTGTHSDLF